MIHSLLIELVRERPSIYDKSHPDYKERQHKFKEITAILNSRFCSNLSVLNIQGMWENLERDFRRTYEVIKHAKSGSDAKVNVTNPYFKDLSFLVQSAEHRPPISTLRIKKESSSIWQRIPERANSWKMKQKKYSAHKEMPPCDNFAHAKIEEKTELKDLVHNVKEMLNSSSHNIVEAISNEEKDTNFVFIYEKLKSISEDKLDQVFTDILKALEEVRKAL